MSRQPLSAAHWIWLPQEQPIPNQYVNFRKTFTLDHVPAQAPLQLSVDSDFVLYVNGIEAARGQYSDFPRRKTYTEVDIAPLLRDGRNTLAVLAYYKGRNFATYSVGKPGMILVMQAGDVTVCSDDAWRVRQSPSFVSGEIAVLTVQLGYTVSYDARQEDDWTALDYVEKAAWANASVQAGATDGFWQELLPRPVPLLQLDPPTPSHLVAQGNFWRHGADEKSIAAIMDKDSLRPVVWWTTFDYSEVLSRRTRGYKHIEPHVKDALVAPDDQWAILTPPTDGADGRYLIVDVGREEAGLLTFRLEAPAGTVVDIAHGEHLDEGRVRMHVGARSFADRFICAEGENTFTLPFRRLGMRYLEIHISNCDTPIRLNYFGLRPTLLPVMDQGAFSTPDPMANRIYDIGKRTLQLCMHEHYEDCPWREQALYAGDSRNQALYGYYGLGNYAFAAACFDLLGHGLFENGLLALTAPTDSRRTIPCYSLLWITDLAEHWLYSGDPSLFKTFDGQIAGMLATGLMQKYEEVSGLYRPLKGEDAWHLYDWMDGLTSYADPDDADRLLDAAYNLYLHEALRNYAWMLEQSGQQNRADTVRATQQALGQAIVRAFWDEDTGAFATYVDDGRRNHYCDLVQTMALAEGLVPPQAEARVLRFLFDGKGYPLTFYTLLYQALALRDRGPEARAFMAQTNDRFWNPMVLAGATSFWETPLGGADFDRAGSLCHAWSSLPVYYYGAYVLGVRPLEPGFTRFAIAPYPDRFSSAEGAIPTPAGPITLRWTRDGNGLHLQAEGPAGLTPALQPFPEASVLTATYNGNPIAEDRIVQVTV